MLSDKIDAALKAGIKTSEFWTAMLAITVVAGADLFKLDLPIDSVYAVASVAVAYIIGRVLLKKKAAEEIKPE